MWSDGNGHIYASIRSAAGRFSAPQTLVSGPDGTAVRAEQLAVGRDGTAVVVWAQAARRSPHYRVMASVRRPHGRFGPAQMVGAAQSVFRSTPNAAVSSHGTIAVVWSRDDAPRIAMAAPRRALRRLARAARLGRPARRRLRGGRQALRGVQLVARAERSRHASPSSALRDLHRGAAAVRRPAPRGGQRPRSGAGRRPVAQHDARWRTGAVDTSESIGMGPIYAARSARGGPFGRRRGHVAGGHRGPRPHARQQPPRRAGDLGHGRRHLAERPARSRPDLHLGHRPRPRPVAACAATRRAWGLDHGPRDGDRLQRPRDRRLHAPHVEHHAVARRPHGSDRSAAG